MSKVTSKLKIVSNLKLLGTGATIYPPHKNGVELDIIWIQSVGVGPELKILDVQEVLSILYCDPLNKNGQDFLGILKSDSTVRYISEHYCYA